MNIDRLAIALCILAVLFIAWVIPAPFLWWTLAGSVVMVWRYRVTGQRELVLAAIVMPVFCLLRAPLCAIVTILTPHTVDALLRPLDFGVGEWWRGVLIVHPGAREALRVAYYDALPAWMGIAIAWSREPGELLKRIVLAAVAAVPLYIMCPAVGPVWVGVAGAPRNCMPSLHLTWALLAWAGCGPKLKWPSGILVVLVAMATIGLGEHYLIDLIVAVPFTWAMWKVPLRIPKIIVDKWQPEV